ATANIAVHSMEIHNRRRLITAGAPRRDGSCSNCCIELKAIDSRDSLQQSVKQVHHSLSVEMEEDHRQAYIVESANNTDCANRLRLHVRLEALPATVFDQPVLPKFRRRDAKSVEEPIDHEIPGRTMPDAGHKKGHEVTQERQRRCPFGPAQ